jgi:multidrug efflux pump subunit AcrA (membrane-fusion protein)
MKRGRRWYYVVSSIMAVTAVLAAIIAVRSSAAVATVGPGEIRRRIVAIGVEVPKKGTALIRAGTAGVVRAVYVMEGAVVRQGQLLAVLEDAGAAVDTRRAGAQRDSTAESVAAGAQGRRKDEEAAADAEVEAAEVEWKMAEDRAKRQALLGPSGTEAVAAQARWEADLAKSRLDATRARRNIVRAGLGRARIVAPVNGTVLTVRVHEGDSLFGATTDPVLFEVADLTETELRAEVDADDARFVEPGQDVTVLQGPAEVGAGIVTRVAQTLERRTNGRANSPELNIRNVWIDVRWQREDHAGLPLGTKYETRIELPPIRVLALVPRSAISVRDGSTTIAVRSRFWSFWPRQVPVELGTTDDRMVEVLNVPVGTRVAIQ